MMKKRKFYKECNQMIKKFVKFIKLFPEHDRNFPQRYFQCKGMLFNEIKCLDKKEHKSI